MSILSSTNSGSSSPITPEKLHSYGFVLRTGAGTIIEPNDTNRDYFEAVLENENGDYLGFWATQVKGQPYFVYSLELNKKEDGTEGNIEMVIQTNKDYLLVKKYWDILNEEKHTDKILRHTRITAKKNILNNLVMLRTFRQQNRESSGAGSSKSKGSAVSGHSAPSSWVIKYYV